MTTQRMKKMTQKKYLKDNSKKTLKKLFIEKLDDDTMVEETIKESGRIISYFFFTKTLLKNSLTSILSFDVYIGASR